MKHGYFLNNIFIGIMKKKHSLVIIDCGENDIQTDIKRLPYVAHHDRIVVQCVEFLDALEAVVDEERLRGQSVAEKTHFSTRRPM